MRKHKEMLLAAVICAALRVTSANKRVACFLSMRYHEEETAARFRVCGRSYLS